MPDGPYARISVLKPHDGHTVDFEAGYIRHLQWHQQARDPWRWYGWTIWAGERQRCLVYATFGRSAANLDNAVDPAGDERDNIVNVTPHAHFAGSVLCEFLPALSSGTGEPSPRPRVELTTIEVAHGAQSAFEDAIAAEQEALQDETLWYRMVAGGTAPRYVCLRPRESFASLLAGRSALPNVAIAKVTIEIMSLRPPLCYGLEARS